MWDAADLAVLMAPDMPGYAVATLSGGGSLPGLFRNAFGPVFGGVFPESSPQFTFPASPFPVLGESIAIRGKTYTVAALEPDETTGMIVAKLK